MWRHACQQRVGRHDGVLFFKNEKRFTNRPCQSASRFWGTFVFRCKFRPDTPVPGAGCVTAAGSSALEDSSGLREPISSSSVACPACQGSGAASSPRAYAFVHALKDVLVDVEAGHPASGRSTVIFQCARSNSTPSRWLLTERLTSDIGNRPH